MEIGYFIINIVEGHDSNCGKIMMVKANPVGDKIWGKEFVLTTENERTEMFDFPYEDNFIESLCEIAKNQEIFHPTRSEFVDVRVYDEDTKRFVIVHRHINLLCKCMLSKPSMNYYIKEITYNDFDFYKMNETWDFSDNIIKTPHGSLAFNSFRECSFGGMNGILFNSNGILDFENNDGCPIESVNISSIAIMRQAGNAWLWTYLFDKGNKPIASLCGYDNLGGLNIYMSDLKEEFHTMSNGSWVI